jgi:hypothetical protein
MRPKAADNLLGRADTDLDVIEFTESGASIQLVSFHEKPSNAVKRLLILFLTKLMEGFQHGTIQLSGAEMGSAIPRNQRARLVTELQISIVSNPDLFERLRVGKVEAIAQINDRAHYSGIFDFAAMSLAFLMCPAFGSRLAVFPKVNSVSKPVPGVSAGVNFSFERNDFSRDRNVASVVANDQRTGNHQRN